MSKNPNGPPVRLATRARDGAVLIAALLVPVLACVTPAAAQQPPAQTQPREHIVRTGDTLWDLARIYLSNPFLWPLIHEANRSIVDNPHRIFPTERLIIPGLETGTVQPLGQPVVAPPPEPPVAVVTEAVEIVDTAATMITTVDLRRPVVSIGEYLATPWLSATAENNVAARIIRSADPTSEGDRLPSTLHPNEYVHLGNLTGARQVGDSLLIVRFGRSVPGFGRLVEPMGVLRVDSVTPTVVTAKVIRQFADARVGDRVLTLGMLPEIGLGDPEPVENGVEGQLLQFMIQEPLHGTGDMAFISLGSRDGIGIGDELAVYIPAREIDNERPERLPPTAVGVVRVVKVTDSSATVRVTGVNSAALRDGLPVRLIRIMP